MERAATTASSLVAEQDSSNINRTQSMATLNESFPHGTNSGSSLRCQDTILGGAEAQIRLKLLLPVLVYAARHTLTAVRHKLMLPGIICYCWIQALVDKKKVIITETSIRSDLKLIKMLQDIDREDLETLWKLVKAKHGNTKSNV
ncbi:hypothetical protein Tco_0485078 [Tanacetum coccineum]